MSALSVTAVRKEEAFIAERPNSVSRNITAHRLADCISGLAYSSRLLSRLGRLLNETSNRQPQFGPELISKWDKSAEHDSLTVGYGFVFNMLASFFNVSARVVGFSTNA